MNITVVGTGYVGLVTGACFSEMGSTVTCVDVDEKKIENLKKGILPIYEPGLEGLVVENHKEGLLRFTTSLEQAAENCDIFFIAVGTPPDENGAADLKYVLRVARDIGRVMNRYSVIVDKSTVPVGTADKVKEVIQEALKQRGIDLDFDVVSNPEFLKEGAAVNDFLRPDRIIIGCDSPRAVQKMKRLYAPFSRNRDKLITMRVRDAEMTKYAANSMLATKISFMNEMAVLCERLGVDVENVRKGIGSDRRIGYAFIYPGCGYGGSCFPKDVSALIRTSRDVGVEPHVLASVAHRNSIQKEVLGKKITARFGNDLSGKIFCLWGLSFKPGTDDMREAPSIVLLHQLVAAGATVQAYDPVAMNQARQILPDDFFKDNRVQLYDTPYDALVEGDALVLVTEWKVFRQPAFKAMAKVMRRQIIFDGRNLYDPVEVGEHGFEYHGIGREITGKLSGE